MSEQYPGGFINKTEPTLNPALGNAAPGVWNMTQVQQAIKAGTWPAYDPYSKYTTLLLHGDGTNGGQNNTFLDSSSNNFTITRNGNTTQGSFSPYGSNWSNYFDGSGDYLVVPTNTAFAYGTGDFTVECWVYKAASGTMTILDATGTGTFGFQFTNTQTVAFASNATTFTFAYVLPLNTWTHIALVRTSGNLYLYTNGGATSSTACTYNFVSSGDYKIGCHGNTVQEFWNGYISNLRIVKGTAVYTGAFTPSTTPLTAITNTSLLTCQSNRFIDNSSNNFTITKNGDTSVQRFSPFAPSAAYSTATIGGSGYFDGSGDYLTIPDNAAWNMGSGDFTAEAWIYPTSFANEAMIMGQWSGDVGGTTLNWALMFSSGSTGYLRLITSSNGSSVLFDLSTSTFALTLNMWQHIAAVRSGSTFTLYVNGVSKATTTNASALYDATNNFTIGAESNTQSQYFAGYISNARVVKGTAVYTGAFTPPTSPVTAVSGTSLLLNYTNGAIFDNAMMNDLETVGNAQISTSVVKYGTGSIYLDGSGDWLLGQSSPNMSPGSGAFTMECWIYMTATGSGNKGILTVGNANSTGNALQFIQNGTTLYINDGSGTNTSIGTLSLNTWTHIALVREEYIMVIW